MEIIFALIFFLVMCFVTTHWAINWGRNGLAWFFFAFFLSWPIAMAALLIAGKTMEMKAEELNKLKALMGETK